MTSFSYLIPLPLYASGFLIDFILRAIKDTESLSTPLTNIRVGFKHKMITSLGIEINTSFENPTFTHKTWQFFYLIKITPTSKTNTN